MDVFICVYVSGGQIFLNLKKFQSHTEVYNLFTIPIFYILTTFFQCMCTTVILKEEYEHSNVKSIPCARSWTSSSPRESTDSSSCLFFCSTFWRYSVSDLILASCFWGKNTGMKWGNYADKNYRSDIIYIVCTTWSPRHCYYQYLWTVLNIVPAIIQQPKTEHWSLQSCSLILSVSHMSLANFYI